MSKHKRPIDMAGGKERERGREREREERERERERERGEIKPSGGNAHMLRRVPLRERTNEHLARCTTAHNAIRLLNLSKIKEILAPTVQETCRRT